MKQTEHVKLRHSIHKLSKYEHKSFLKLPILGDSYMSVGIQFQKDIAVNAEVNFP